MLITKWSNCPKLLSVNSAQQSGSPWQPRSAAGRWLPVSGVSCNLFQGTAAYLLQKCSTQVVGYTRLKVRLRVSKALCSRTCKVPVRKEVNNRFKKGFQGQIYLFVFVVVVFYFNKNRKTKLKIPKILRSNCLMTRKFIVKHSGWPTSRQSLLRQ